MINGLSLTHKHEIQRRGKKENIMTPPEISNIQNIRKSYDSRNMRTNEIENSNNQLTHSTTVQQYQQLKLSDIEDTAIRGNSEKQSRRKGRSTSNYHYKKQKIRGNSSNRVLVPGNRPGIEGNGDNLSSRPFSFDSNKMENGGSRGQRLELSNSEVNIQLQNQRFNNMKERNKNSFLQ